MLHRIKWIIRRVNLKKNKILDSHYDSYADEFSIFEGYNYISKRVQVFDSKFGFFSYANNDSKISNADIGRFTCIGPDVIIGGLGQHPVNRKSTHRMFYSKGRVEWGDFCLNENFNERKKIIIKNDVWIGARATILDGVTIGDGAIIAAGAVVTKDVEPYSIVGGVPAKLIRYRFDQSTREQLLEQKWWLESLDVIKNQAKNGLFSVELI